MALQLPSHFKASRQRDHLSSSSSQLMRETVDLGQRVTWPLPHGDHQALPAPQNEVQSEALVLGCTATITIGWGLVVEGVMDQMWHMKRGPVSSISHKGSAPALSDKQLSVWVESSSLCSGPEALLVGHCPLKGTKEGLQLLRRGP